MKRIFATLLVVLVLAVPVFPCGTMQDPCPDPPGGSSSAPVMWVLINGVLTAVSIIK